MMNSTNEIGLNKEMVDTLPINLVVVVINGIRHLIRKEKILEIGKVKHYNQYEEQYFVPLKEFNLH